MYTLSVREQHCTIHLTHKSVPRSHLVITQQSGRLLQKLYRTSLATRESRVARTVSFPDRVSRPVDRPRPFLHVLRSAQNAQSPEQSESAMHELESESILVCPT